MSDQQRRPAEDGDHAALSRRYRETADTTPPAAIDQAILARARQAVSGKRPRPLGRGPFSGSWMVPASLAAVLVLSVSVVLLSEDAMREPPRTPPVEESSQVTGRATAPAESMLEPAKPPAEPASLSLDEAREPLAPVPRQSPRMGEKARPGAILDRGLQAPAAPAEQRSTSFGKMADTLEKEDQDRPVAEPAPPSGTDPRLIRIGELWRGGERERAYGLLREFQANHPDYPLDTFLATLPGYFSQLEDKMGKSSGR